MSSVKTIQVIKKMLLPSGRESVNPLWIPTQTEGSPAMEDPSMVPIPQW